MSGPKHLWSGDWQRESEAAAAARAARGAQRPAPAPAAPVAPPPRRPRPSPTPRAAARPQRPTPARERPRRRARRLRVSPPVAFAAVAVLVVAGAAWGLSTLLGGGSRASRTAPPAPLATAATPNPPASPAASTRQVNWLGMDIVTQPPGIAVVQTVALGTAADRAGINPGDVIVSINGRSITSATDIPSALRGLAAGSQVTLQLAYGSDVSQAELALGKPPSISP